MKIVELHLGGSQTYFDITLPCQQWANYLATDRDGCVWAYEDKPYKQNNHWDTARGETEHIATVDLEGMDWKDTLVEVG